MARKPKAKAGDSTATEPGPKHNGGPPILTDEQTEALFHLNLNAIRPAIGNVEHHVSVLRGLYKKAKADGFTKKDVEFALRLEKVADGEISAERARQDQLAKWMQHPLGAQADLFADKGNNAGAGLEPMALTTARLAGRLVGLRGEPAKLPDGYTGEVGNAFMEGWHDGQNALFNIKELKNPPPPVTPLEKQIEETAAAS